jgi:hypothetical protein
MCPELRRTWSEGRAADGVSPADTGVGRITDVWTDDGVCALHEYENTQAIERTARSLGDAEPYGPHWQDAIRATQLIHCPGPWYGVDFGDGPSNGCSGIYSEHELEPA